MTLYIKAEAEEQMRRALRGQPLEPSWPHDDPDPRPSGPAAAKAIYLSGPMKGYPESNYPMFHRVAAELRERGHYVYNPAEFEHNGPHETFPLRKAFAEYSAFICNEADAIVLLPGWEKSMGVSAELALAKNCGLEIIELRFDLTCL